jgi:Cys-rich repeat protein
LSGAGLVVACATEGTPGPPESTGQVSSAIWTNGGFETGAGGAAPVSWNVATFVNQGITVQTPQTYAGLDLIAGGNALTTTIAATNQADPNLGAGASLRVCRYGSQCGRVNFHSSTTYGNGKNVNVLSQTMTASAGDVDPSDSQIHVRFAVAPVLQNPAHTADEQPYYFVIVTDTTQGTTLYSDFNLSGTAGLAWQKINAGLTTEIDYTDWQLIDVSGASGAIVQGDQVELRVIGAGCSLGGHYGEVYVDGVGPVVPGLSVEGTAPAQANAGANITYTLTYRNGSAATAPAETGVVIDFATPPNTTFQSITPPTGATCTTPAVGSAGMIVCTFSGSVASGASGTFAVTVAIATGTMGTIVAGNYQIHSTQETPLLGPPIFTLCGCTQDANCPSGDWCNETASNCTPDLPNGTAVPTDTAHTNPTLNGTCTAAAGALTCASTVCDTSDNECGYANGDGPCTSGNGATRCRSGACSTNGTCVPAGGCNVDADCTGGKWCDESTHACTTPVANGGAVPTDPAHTSPTLNGTCTAAAGALTCASTVCDTSDNKCGYANGDGPCTSGNGATRCRSGACSANGTCESAGSCYVDGDCTAGHWCDESTHTCTPTGANGAPVPDDPAHVSPTLDGGCTAAAGALTCTSGVCDTDNACGYGNGHGPCVAGDGGASAVCRSDLCATSGTASGVCVACLADADCPTGTVCSTTNTCVVPVPDAGALDGEAPTADAAAEAGEEDGGEQDAAEDAPAEDGAPPLDAATDAADGESRADATTDSGSDGGYIEGGGCSAASRRGGGDAPATAFGMVTFLTLLASRRRRGRQVVRP